MGEVRRKTREVVGREEEEEQGEVEEEQGVKKNRMIR